MKRWFVILIVLLPAFVAAQDQLDINLRPGRNIISCNLILPDQLWANENGPDVARIFNLVEDLNGMPLSLLLSQDGSFYSPQWGWCNIPFWNTPEGYIAMMDRAAVLQLEGERVPVDIEIPLTNGWNILSYLPTEPSDASFPDYAVLDPIIARVQWAVDENGNFMAPEWGFSNMPPWVEGRGYYVRLNGEVDFMYSAEAQDHELIIPIVGDHWQVPVVGYEFLSILVLEINGGEARDGDMIGAYTMDGEVLCGCGTVQAGRCGITVWGDNQSVQGVDGLLADETPLFVYWLADEDREVEIGIENVVEGTPRFSPFGTAVITIQADIGERQVERRLRLGDNWRMISLNIDPVNFYNPDEEFPGPDVQLLFADLVDDEGESLVDIVKDETGNFWYPEENFINIPYWELTDGYLVKMREDCELVARGNPIPYDADIPIHSGWNMIAYFPDFVLDCTMPEVYAIQPMIDRIDHFKNEVGGFVSPEWEYSNIEFLSPGEGFMVKSAEQEEFIFNYPEEDRRANGIMSGDQPIDPSVNGLNTGKNMSVLVNSIEGLPQGGNFIIGAFGITNELLGIGAVVDSRCGLAVWGDDMMTPESDGAHAGEPFALRLLDECQQPIADLDVISLRRGEMVYSTDDLTVIDVAVRDLEIAVGEGVPDDFYLSSGSPNPFNAVTRLTYGLIDGDNVNLSVYDVTGKHICTLFSGEQTAGVHATSWNAEGVPSGTYLVRLSASSGICETKVILMK